MPARKKSPSKFPDDDERFEEGDVDDVLGTTEDVFTITMVDLCREV